MSDVLDEAEAKLDKLVGRALVRSAEIDLERRAPEQVADAKRALNAPCSRGLDEAFRCYVHGDALGMRLGIDRFFADRLRLFREAASHLDEAHEMRKREWTALGAVLAEPPAGWDSIQVFRRARETRARNRANLLVQQAPTVEAPRYCANPTCPTPDKPLAIAATGRPRETCSDRCRVALNRHRKRAVTKP